jgi:phenylpropionate dioxygenase-like ring-hydroxylating dioxygenase large terminal subunit
MTHVFGAVWVYLAHESQIPNVDDFVTARLGLRPLIVVRDSEGRIRALYNRCTHRGARVCRSERGNARTFQCAYHGWSYFNTGKLRGVPWPEGYACDFKDARFSLAQVPRVESYRGFIFGTLNLDAPPLPEYLGGVRKPIDEWLDRHPGGKVLVAEANRLKYKGNWKLAYDNAADGYHVVFSHRSLLEMENRLLKDAEKGMSFYMGKPDEGPIYVQVFANGHHFKDKRPAVEARPGALGEKEAATPGKEAFEKRISDGRARDLAAAPTVNINVFPNLSILGNHIQAFQPLAVDETDTTWYATAIVDEANELGGAAHEINLMRMRTQEAFPNFGEVDDAVNFEEIQRGLAACEDEWVYMHRGLGVSGRIKTERDGSLTAPATDEVFMREHMKVWKRLMSTEPRIHVLR